MQKQPAAAGLKQAIMRSSHHNTICSFLQALCRTHFKITITTRCERAADLEHEGSNSQGYGMPADSGVSGEWQQGASSVSGAEHSRSERVQGGEGSSSRSEVRVWN